MTYAIISSFFWTTFAFIAKYIITMKMKNFISFTYFQGILIVLIFPILSYAIVSDQIYLPPLETVPYAVVSGGTSILAYLLLYYGLTKYDVSSATPIVSVETIFVVPLSYIFLGEFYGLDVILWILIAMGGAIMTSWDENIKTKQLLSFRNKALWTFLIVAFLYASGNVAVKPAMKYVSNYNFLIWREFAWFGVLLLLLPLIFHKEERRILRTKWKGALRVTLVAILIQYFGYLLMFYSLGFSVQITKGLMASGGFFAVIIGFLLSKTSSRIFLEKHSSNIYLVRLIGALLILFAIYKLSYA